MDLLENVHLVDKGGRRRPAREALGVELDLHPIPANAIILQITNKTEPMKCEV